MRDYLPNERIRQNPRKGTKQNGDKHVADKEFKVTVKKMLTKIRRQMDELSENDGHSDPPTCSFHLQRPPQSQALDRALCIGDYLVEKSDGVCFLKMTKVPKRNRVLTINNKSSWIHQYLDTDS